jgi:two-component sensor histidine kinase
MGDQHSEPAISIPECGTGPPLPVNEPQRLAALKRYDLLDTPPEQAFDRITRLAACVLGMPISLVTLLDETRQWFKARYGLDSRWTSREIAFCSYTILDTDTLVVPDAVADDRFATNPLVTEDPHIRFYAGAPLITPDGYTLGTLCVIDRRPHPEFSDEQRRLLEDLADLVMMEIEARSATLALRQEIRKHQETEQRLHRTLAEKETLLREVYHRVKNNLQVVDTLLALQIRQIPVAAESLRELRYRVYSLGLVHQKLMQSENLEMINLRDFIRDLCQTLATPYGQQLGNMSLNVAVEADGVIDIDSAITLGLLITELVSNAYKHAFLSDRSGTVDVSLTSLGNDRARLIVADTGVGLSASPQPITIGQQIIAELVDQLGAEMTVHQNHGAQISVTFPCPLGLPC